MRILGYRGTSLTSHAIKLQTRSIYSHIGMQLRDGSVVEAWADGFSIKAWRKFFLEGSVRQIENPFVKHADDTLIDVFGFHPTVAARFDEEAATKYLLSQIGQNYDYSSVARFLSRRQATNNEEKFCNELGELACIEGGVRLLRGNPSEHSPRDMLLSPLLVFEETIWKGK
jgi:uncharacterized protein YycO